MTTENQFDLKQAVIEESALSVNPATVAAAVAVRVPKDRLRAALEDALVVYAGWAMRQRRTSVWGRGEADEEEEAIPASRPSKYERNYVSPSRWEEILAQPIYGLNGNVRLGDATLADVTHARDWHRRQSAALAGKASMYAEIADAMAALGAKVASELQENLLLGIVTSSGERRAIAA